MSTHRMQNAIVTIYDLIISLLLNLIEQKAGSKKAKGPRGKKALLN